MSTTRRIFLFLGLPLILVFAIVVAWAFQGRGSSPTTSNNDDKGAVECDAMVSPTDVSKATGILYPGQERGGDYKPHGGFRFDGLQNDDVTVLAPYNASVAAASRYIEQGEIQYLIEFMTDCGLTFRFDHLKTLSAKLQAMADKLPEAKVDDSRTSQPSVPTDLTAGEVVATAVGFEKGDRGPNVSFDFGVYDKTKRNAISISDAAWAAEHEDEKELAWYAICWFDLLPNTNAAIVKTLPAGDSIAGKTSDYCN